MSHETMVLYNSSCLDITSEHTPDPWITSAHGKFYLTFTGNDRIPMWDATSLMDFYDRPAKGPVWRARADGPQSERFWAPELHLLRGRWYVYFAAADRRVGNRSHRMYVLGGPDEAVDPHRGPWELLGSIRGMDQRQWAIDGTVFEVSGKLYFAYSGWPRRENGWEEHSDALQQLFILELLDPMTAAPGAPVMISHPSQDWERMGASGPAINEGPQWLLSPTKDWRGLVYSCGPSWTHHYKMATLEFLGGDPLDPAAWRKSERPLLQNRQNGLGPYGPGHGCFLHADGETVALFHATDRVTDGNQNRRTRMQRVRWTSQGPDMGGYVGAGTNDVDLFLQDASSRRDDGNRSTESLRGLVRAVKGMRVP